MKKKTQDEMERKTHSFFLSKERKNGEMERKTHSPKPKAKKRKDVVKWSVKRIHNQFWFSVKKNLIISLNALLLSYAH